MAKPQNSKSPIGKNNNHNNKQKHKKPQKRPSLSQRKTLVRREQVHYLILTEGLNANQIATKLDHDYNTIKLDIEALTEDSDFWLNAQTRAGWAIQTKNIISSTFEEIKRLNGQLELIESEADDDNYNFPKNPYHHKTEKEDFLKYADIERKAYQAFQQRQKHYGEYAHLQNAITHKKNLIKEFMEELPLYYKVQELDRWIQAHQKTEEMIAPIETKN